MGYSDFQLPTVTGAEIDRVGSSTDVAVMVATPAEDGVKSPEEVIVPPVADHVTALLKAPDPFTEAAHWVVCAIRMAGGEHVTATEVIVPTPTLAEPDFVESSVEVAVMLAVPVDDGVKIPAEVMVPPVADHVTALLKAPDPFTEAAHWEVCVTRIGVGEHVTATEVIAATPTLAEPDFVESSVDIAVMLAVPVDDGVKTPAEVIVPPLADHVTELM